MPSRRTVLKFITGIPVLITGGYLFVRPKYSSVVKRAIFNKLFYLNLDSAGVEQFSMDFVDLYNKGTLKVISIDVMTRLSEQYTGLDLLVDRVAVFEDFVAEQYLLSSDFFVNNQNEGRSIKYRDISYSDPYRSPCSNAFATWL